MIVCKFGGTSVRDREAQERLAAIVRDRLDEAPVVVVSALSGVSDGLIGVLDAAVGGDDDRSAGDLEAIGERHRALLAATPAPDDARREAAAAIEPVLAELESLRRGIVLLGEASPHARARFVGAGELLSSRLVVAALRRAGIPTAWADARETIATAGVEPEKDPPVLREIGARSAERLAPLLEPGKAVVTQGFIGSDPSGRASLLGRGGSDYSASLLGAALGATRVEIWTDVDGVLTANPRIVPTARRVRLLSFGEASELAYFGARVLHPQTLLPAMERSIPVLVLNSLRPKGRGTTIVAEGIPPADDRWVVKSIADKRGITLVHVVSSRMLMAHGFLARIFGVFDAFRTSVDLLATSEVSVSLTVDDDRRLPEIVEELSKFASVEVERGLAVICLVGEGMRGRAGIAEEVFRAVRSSHVRLITQGASAINLSLVLPEKEAAPAIRSLHEAFFGGSLPAEIFGEAVAERGTGARTEVPRGLLAELARAKGTPLYVYDLEVVATRVAALSSRLPRAPSRMFYACKANAHPAIVRLMKDLGVGIECASPGEVERALSCGLAPGDVLLCATNGRAADLARELRRGVRLSLGSRSDVERVGALAPGGRVLLRVNPGVGGGHHAHVVTGGAHSKFGIPIAEVAETAAAAERSGLAVIGLHSHVGSGIVDTDPLFAAADRLLEAAADIPSVVVVDLGGGFGIPYRERDRELDLDTWRDGIEARLEAFERATGRRPEVWVEPGRYLVGPAGWLVAEVTCRKISGGLVFVGVDTGMNHLLRPALYGAYHRIANLSAPDAPEEWVEVVGNVCETTDVLASSRPLPRPEEGHLLAILDAGAYGFAMASGYNLWPLPREVVVRGGGEAT